MSHPNAEDDALQIPRSLAGEHLYHALDELDRAGDSCALYSDWARDGRDLRSAALGLAHIEAVVRHGRHLRAAVLFAAFAAEAYVNEFLATYLEGDVWDKLERKPTIHKYVKGTCRALGGESLFRVDVPPLPVLTELFELRHRLVHPKPGYGPPTDLMQAARERYQDCLPDRAAMYIVSVAAAALVMLGRTAPGELDFPASFIWLGRSAVQGYGSQITTNFPSRCAAVSKPLWEQVFDEAHRRPNT